MSAMRKEQSDYLNYKNYEALKCTVTSSFIGNLTGHDYEVKTGERFPFHHHRRERRTSNSTGSSSAPYYPQMSHYNEDKKHNRSTYHGQAIVPRRNNCSSDSTLPLNEESSTMKIKILSAFSLNPNISINPSDKEDQERHKFEPGGAAKPSVNFSVLWQPENQAKGAVAKCGETYKVPFAFADSKKSRTRSQTPTIHFFEGVDNSMFPNNSTKNTVQDYKSLITYQEISAENKKLPNYSSTWYKRDNPAHPLHHFPGKEAKRKEFQQERNDLHEEVHNNSSEKFDYILGQRHEKPNIRSSQTATVRQNQVPVSVDRRHQVASNSLFAEAAVKRTKQVAEFDESIVTDTTTRGLISSLGTTAGDHLPVVSSPWIVEKDTHWENNAERELADYIGNIRLPCPPQPLHLRALQALKKLKNEAIQKRKSLSEGFLEKTHTSAATVPSKEMDKLRQRKSLWKSGNSKRKFLTKQILLTPEPELFENLEELNLKNDEEPVVKVPNYFLDLSFEYTKNEPLTLLNNPRSHITNTSSPSNYCPVQKMQYTKVKQLLSQDWSKIPCESNSSRRQADSFLWKPSQRDSGINFSEDKEPEAISALQALDAATPMTGTFLQRDNPIPLESKETKPKDALATTDIRKIYKRIGGAYPSVKPTPDFSRLLPPSPKEIACDDSSTKGLVLDNTDQQLQVTKNPLCFSKGIERAKEFSTTCLTQHRPQNAQHILSASERSKVIHGLAVDKFSCLSSGNYCADESSGKQIIANSTETSAGENATAKVHEGRKHHCDVCGRAFSRSNTLTTHKRIHTGDRPFPCDLCGKAFRQLGNLSRHKLTHAAVKPHVCPKCNKSFSRTSNLNTHLRTHTNYKPFVCDFCGKGFHQNMDMKIHRYTHTGEKPHKCVTCGRGFKQVTHLKYHMRTHSAERLYKCQHCGKGFNQKGNLQAHIYGHTGKRPYRCDICGKGFTLTSTLNTHKRIHAPNKPFKCEFCQKAFYQKNALKTHYISSHPYTDGVCLL